MANSFVLYNGNGSQQNFTVSFPYIDEDHVSIQVDDVEVPSTWVNSTTIRATTAPAAGTGNVKVLRVTPRDALVTFSDSAQLTAADLNLLATQSRYVSEEIEDAYQAEELVNLSVSTAHLQASAVTTAKIADSNVTTAKIADLNVTTDKINDLAVTTGKIAALAVTDAKLAADSVITAKILDLNVTTGKLAADAVTTAKILDANVTQAKLLYPAGYTGYVLLQDQKASGTAGGGSTATTWTKHDLNTEVVDTGNHAALASSVITLAAGTYRVRGSACFHQAVGCRVRLRNTADSATLALGTISVCPAAANDGTVSLLSGRFTLAAQKTVELQYWVGAAKATDGLGLATTSGEVEVYADLELIRE